MASRTRTIEVEWQFDVRDVEVVQRWLRAARFGPRWAVEPSRVQSLRDVYFDGDAWPLLRAGYALRIRRSTPTVEGTLKATERGRAGLMRRREITARLADARVTTVRRSRGVLGVRLRRLLVDRALRRLFTVRTRRRTYRLLRDGRPVGEIALDRTVIVPPRGRPRRLQRLEVEVLAGDPAVVALFVATLRRARHLRIARRSKFEEGLAAAGYAPRRS